MVVGDIQDLRGMGKIFFPDEGVPDILFNRESKSSGTGQGHRDAGPSALGICELDGALV